MNKQQALRLVGDHLAGRVEAETLEEASGVDQSELEQLSDADAERLEWATREAARRLRTMGGDSRG